MPPHCLHPPAGRPAAVLALGRRAALAGAILALLLGAASPASAADEDWLDAGYSARHRLDVPASLGPSVDAAHADITTHGLLRSDAADLRIFDSRGQVCPHQLLEIGPGDRVRFLFRVTKGETTYYAYFGNRIVMSSAEAWNPTAGVVLEVRDLPSGIYRRAPEVIALWEKATHVQGRALVPRIFQGANPVGLSTKPFIARFRGQLRISAPGAYRIVTTSSDASVVLIDGRVVAQWGGVHHAAGGRRGRFGSSVNLTAGLHLVEYYWIKADRRFPPAAVLGIQSPDDLGPKLAAARAFVQPVYAKVRGVEFQDGSAVADFDWKPLHHIENNGLFAVAYEFWKAPGLHGDEDLVWAFPDGSRLPGKRVRKVFFGTGPRQVTLVAPGEDGTAIETSLVVDVQPVWAQARPPKGKHLNLYRRGFEQPDPELVGAGELAAMAALADDLDFTDRIGALWSRLKTRSDLRNLEGIPRVAQVLGARFQRPPFGSAVRAEEALRLGIVMARDATTRLRLQRQLADLLVNARGDADAAESLAARLDDLRDDPAELRRLRILQGDIAAERGDAEEAARLYEQAGAVARPWTQGVVLRRDSLLFSVADYLRRREYAGAVEALEDWRLAQPHDRREPYVLWLLARAYAGLECNDRAAVLFGRALRLDPRGATAPRILLALADLKRRTGDVDDALAKETLLLEMFPYSEEAARLHARRKGIEIPGGS